jgi:uncharacterized protein (TIGR00251 family)
VQEAWYRWQDEALLLRVRVQPRAKRDELIGPQSGHLKVRITAPPVDGKANDHLCRFLAKEFGVPQSRVELLAGDHTRLKRVRIFAPRKLPAPIASAQNR